MIIERIQIEEGFLNGFDVCLRPGLNVVIGARGTGKTTLIELIRFCLGVEGYTSETTKRSREHALSVLGSGQVTLTLIEDGRRITVSRSANDPAPRSSGPFLPPIVLSQTEIETVGLQSGGRLRLLDGFIGDQRSTLAAETEAVTSVRSLTSEANSIRADIEQLDQQLAELPSILEQIDQVAPQELQLAALSADTNAKTGQLSALSATISAKSVASVAIQRFSQGVERWRASIGGGVGMSSEAWPAGAGGDPLGELRTRVGRAHEYINYALQELAAVASASAAMASQIEAEKVGLEDQARNLRREVEALQTGAGEIVRRGQLLRERKAQLESLQAVRQALIANLQTVIERRNQALDSLETMRNSRFEARTQAAFHLNQVLGPRIRIGVMRGGQSEAFASALTEALRGSGLRYNDLVSALTPRISPRELLEAVDNDDFDLIATRGSMTIDRAAKVVVALKDADLGSIATVPVDDYVTLSLMDGPDHKDIGELSTGQRCTVILPLVLRHMERLLIVDQPEDHIDNAFIADTLIKSILARPANGQMLFSTHNANIPVLGAADFVIQLSSDGRRGFPIAAGALADPPVVHAITSVMEGGAAAFRQRATFYGSQGLT
ncbi:AAA family ATPase [Pelagerythrobacter aerophilus]|uniref:ATP-binding protein n=1 Tax=Pelagerythrobacter aerophilus TaxID=2306995 RepID=A0A418NKF0_9SPHN|nr:AAA family ATPase [Pelagerythrobacter aerophilus]RIV79972.1 ATP-binding protein [Pelagerythrobacter aerophilus]